MHCHLRRLFTLSARSESCASRMVGVVSEEALTCSAWWESVFKSREQRGWGTGAICVRDCTFTQSKYQNELLKGSGGGWAAPCRCSRHNNHVRRPRSITRQPGTLQLGNGGRDLCLPVCSIFLLLVRRIMQKTTWTDYNETSWNLCRVDLGEIWCSLIGFNYLKGLLGHCCAILVLQ